MTESFRNLKLSHIEPIYLIRVCLRDLWMVILASLCCAMLAGTALILFFPNRVQADVTLVVTNRVANASVIQTSKSATQAAETFSSLINTDLVRTRIAKEAGYPDYDGRFKVSVRSDTNLVDVSLVADTAREAYALIKTVCDNYVSLSDYVDKNIVVIEYNMPNITASASTRISRTTVMLIAAVLGGLLMLAWLIISYLAQDVIQNETAARDLLDARLLATIGHEKTRRRHRSILVSDPTVSFAFTEAMQKLCTLLEQKRAEHGGGVFAICSLCEHEGKTMLSDNLAYTMQWQYSEDRNQWVDIPNATEETMDVVVTEENNLVYWRIIVYVEEAQEE